MAAAHVTGNVHCIPKMEPPSHGADDRPQSALARGVQITEFQETKVNPEPVIVEESDILMESFLSPRKLQLLTGIDNLDNVKSLELKVDTTETSLGNFGSLLPNLAQLKLFSSNIPCIRDLGSSLRKLEVLWLPRCGLQELDGIFSMSSLMELYLSFNGISDITALSMLDELKVLDLEGNNIDDISQVNYLAMCPKLRNLTMEDNPICVMPHPDEEDPSYNYRQAIKTAIPHLEYLDDEPLVEGEELQREHNVFDEDWAFMEKLTRDGTISEPVEDSNSEDTGSSRAGSATLRPASGRPGSGLRLATSYRPLTASRRRPATTGDMSGRPGTAQTGSGSAASRDSQEPNNMEDVTSDLTLGRVICGNPSRALLSRNKQTETSGKASMDFRLFPQACVFQHKPEHTFDPLPDEDRDRSEILDELKSWRDQHEKRMEKIHESRRPQVLIIDQDESFSVSGDSDLEYSDSEQMENDDSPLEVHEPNDLSSQRKSKGQRDSINGQRVPFSKMRGMKHDESFDADQEFVMDKKQASLNTSVKSQRAVYNSSGGASSPASHIPGPITPRPPASRPLSLTALRSQSPIPSRLMNDSRVLPSPPGVTRSTNDIGQKALVSPETTQPVIRGLSEKPAPPTQRPYTARAALGLPAQPRIRRSLPQVPSLPSKPSVPK
ncbi:hypothetical protein ScPMuIL_015314 [Solemya velum]